MCAVYNFIIAICFYNFNDLIILLNMCFSQVYIKLDFHVFKNPIDRGLQFLRYSAVNTEM